MGIFCHINYSHSTINKTLRIVTNTYVPVPSLRNKTSPILLKVPLLTILSLMINFVFLV